MVSSPGGARGPANAFSNHLSAIESSKKYTIKDISLFNSIEALADFDVFWFSVRFHPDLYFLLKRTFPDKKFLMGPNVLFEKAEIGPSDPWEKWFVENVECDIYCNKADFYLDRVREFYRGSKKYEVLRNCIDLKNYESVIESREKRDIDVLIYYKNRRIDNQLSDLFPVFMEKFGKLGLTSKVIEYGSYNREDYFKLLGRSKSCVWLSIEDFCANAQLEAQYFNVPVIGTRFNCTDTYDHDLNVDAANIDSTSWITWKEDMPDLFCKKIIELHSEKIEDIDSKPSDFIKENHSYDAYISQIDRILE